MIAQDRVDSCKHLLCANVFRIKILAVEFLNKSCNIQMGDADSHSHIKLLLKTQAITYLTNHSGIYIEFFTLQVLSPVPSPFCFPTQFVKV